MKCCSAFLLVFSSTPLYAQVPPEPLTNCTAEPTDQTITIGTVVECNIDVAGDQDLYRFAGTANSVVVVSLLNLTFGPSPVADLFAPGNATPFETLGAGTDSREVLLPATGTYTIRVAESGNDQAVLYRIGLERLFPASPNASPLDFGLGSGTQTIDPAPDQDFYTFSARQDSVVTLTLSNLTFGPSPVARLFAPDQTLVTTLGPGTDSEDITLPREGLYTVRLFESGNDQPDTYTLNLQCLFPPTNHPTCKIETPTPTCNGLTPTILGTSGNDNLNGTSGNDVIAGLDGNDRISGFGGNDVICGDSDQGGTGSDTLLGNIGDDRLFGNGGINVLYGDAGNDALKGGDSRDVLFGGRGDDSLDGQGDDDVLVGGANNDVLKGGSGTNDVCAPRVEDLTPATGCEISR